MNHNHANYQARLDFVQELLSSRYNAQADILPIQYDPDSPFKYNNFVYRAAFTTPIPCPSPNRDAHSPPSPPQPGCVPLPAGTTQLIVRLANPDTEGMHMATRVENEVAIISLASAALEGFQPRIVPQVYAWGSAAGGKQGWILQELMPGAPLGEFWGGMGGEEKSGVFVQMARILKGLQGYALPGSITGFGGVTFDGAGRVVSAAMPTVGAGPWGSFEESFRGRLEVALGKADGNPYIKGWRKNGLRERLDRFVAQGVPAQFEGLGGKGERVVCHADFNGSNLLFDPASGLITALIDYDFATILHPSYEFLRSFSGAGGQFRGRDVDDSGADAALRHAKLHGFPSPLPPTEPDGQVTWEDAKAWEDALESVGVEKRPRTIEGIEGVADVDTVLQAILPWRVSNADVLRLQTEETILQCRDENEVHLDKLLGLFGY